jgi:pSer/pThr/pTyr-binding forkhead associated (FHA) protein
MAVKLVVRHPKRGAGEPGEISFEFEQTRLVVGRSPGADIRLPDLTVSELHATLEQQDGQVRLRDEGSTNGTRVNGVALVPSRPRTLAPGDSIDIGEFTLLFASGPLLGAPTSPERTASLARRLVRELASPGDELSAPPCLRIVEGPDEGTLVNLEDPPARLVVGRGGEASLVLADVDVSREHFEVLRDLDGSLARDLSSKNGLEVNGKRLRERRLRHGDALRVGNTRMIYEDPAERALKALEGQADVTLTRTREAQLPPVPEEPPAVEAAEPAPSTPPAPATPEAGELMVYALAALVLIASLAGLAWLFG